METQGADRVARFSGQTWGEFELGEPIGRGPRGTVYRARQASIDRAVAVKVLDLRLSDDSGFRRRFLREAVSVGRIASPHVVHIHFAGVRDGHPWVAMELVDGQDLGTRLRGGLRPSPGAVFDLVLQAARGLAAAERQGVLHRDLKPANLLVGPDGVLKISDFGLVGLVAEAGGAIGADARWASPERLAGRACDHRSDVWSLGAVAYELLAGRTPALGSDGSPAPLAPLAPKAHPEFVQAVMRCLHPDPAQRWAGAEALQAGLEELLLRGRVMRRRWQPWTAAAFAAAAVAAMATWAGARAGGDGARAGGEGVTPAATVEERFGGSHAGPPAVATTPRDPAVDAMPAAAVAQATAAASTAEPAPAAATAPQDDAVHVTPTAAEAPPKASATPERAAPPEPEVVRAVAPAASAKAPVAAPSTTAPPAEADPAPVPADPVAADPELEADAAAAASAREPEVATMPAPAARATTASVDEPTTPTDTEAPTAPAAAAVGVAGTGRDELGHYADLQVLGMVQRFRWCPPGSFIMGSPDGERRRSRDEVPLQVTLTQGFWIADTECSQALWMTVLGSSPSAVQDLSHPVERVTWDDAHRFIDRLNALGPALSVRLPTEAEWEYACRAGGGGGDGAWDAGRGRRSHPIAQLESNAWGLFDMRGNVAEWCADGYGPYRGPVAVDPLPAPGGAKVHRGGSFRDRSDDCRPANRSHARPETRAEHIGFRLAASTLPGVPAPR